MAAREMSVEAAVSAVGSPLATSLANDGPLTAAMRGVNPEKRLTTSRMTSVMRRSVSFSMPFDALTNSMLGRSHCDMCSKVRRQWCDGITLTTISAPDSASFRSFVALTEDGTSIPGRNRLLTCDCCRLAATSFSYAQRQTSCFARRPATMARAVPQAPAPITATRLTLAPPEVEVSFALIGFHFLQTTFGCSHDVWQSPAAP